MGSKCISRPLQGSPYGCVGCLVPVQGPCGRICTSGLLTGCLAFSSFSASSPPPGFSLWKNSVIANSSKGILGLESPSAALMDLLGTIEIAHRPLLVEKLDGGSIRLISSIELPTSKTCLCLPFLLLLLLLLPLQDALHNLCDGVLCQMCGQGRGRWVQG